jgi:hypothetical protein
LTLATAEQLAGEVEAVTDSAGRSIVAWRDESSGVSMLRFRRVEADGTLGPAGDLSNAASGDAREIELAAAPAGEVVAVWSQGLTLATEEIRARRIAPDGSLGPIQTLSAQDASFPRIGVDPAGNGYAVWQRDDGVEDEVEGRLLPAGGGAPGPIRGFSTESEDATGPQLALNDTGTGLVIWRRSVEEGELRSSTFTLGGMPAASVLLAGGEDQIRTPALASRPDGGFLILFSQTTGAPDFEEAVQRRTVSAAGVVSAVADVSAYGNHAGGSALAVDGSGVATAVWTYRKENTETLRLQARRIDQGGSLGPLLPGVSGVASSPQTREVGVDGSGNATVVWDWEDPLFEVLTRRLFPDGALESPTDTVLAAQGLAANPREALTPSLAVAPDGAALVAFLRSGGGQPDDQIQAVRFIPPPAAAAPPSNRFRFGKLKRNRKKGTAKLTVIVPGPGRLILAKTKAVKGANRSARAAGRVTIPIVIRGRTKGRLARLAGKTGIGRVRVRIRVTFAPTGGTPLTLSKRLTLVKRLRARG